MKTCVLFPNAFGQPYLEGSAALKSTIPPSFELYLNPQELGRSKRPENGNGHLSLLSGTRRAQVRKYPRLLHVEDSPQLRLLLSVFLKYGFELVILSIFVCCFCVCHYNKCTAFSVSSYILYI